ncbi:MAG: hypothetical protein ACYTGX_06245 [Planctomycetota bacterium]|jgi:hypothetical protein
MSETDDALDLDRLRDAVHAIGILGAPVDALLERLDQAGGAGGPVMLDEIEEVSAVVLRVQKAVQEALSGAARGDTADVQAGAVMVGLPEGADVGPLVQAEVAKALETTGEGWRADILARTVAEVSQKTAKGLSDLIQSRAFLDRIVPQVLSKAEETARRAVGELGLSLRQQIREELEKAGAGEGGGGGGGASAATGAPVNLEEVFDSHHFKEALEARLHHIVKYIENDVVPDTLKKIQREG